MGGGLYNLSLTVPKMSVLRATQITFWKVTYRRHTNFAMESIEQTFNGQADFVASQSLFQKR